MMFAELQTVKILYDEMKTIFLQFKDRQMISAHAILNNPSIIPTFVNSIK